MTDFTDKQLEWAARLLCVAIDIDPDAVDHNGKKQWQNPITRDEGRRLLAELDRQGVKATSRDHLWYGQWGALHDTASICPDAE